VRKLCEYAVGKLRSSEPGSGVLNSAISTLFLLKNINPNDDTSSYIKTFVVDDTIPKIFVTNYYTL
jgi:hypothetical protein